MKAHPTKLELIDRNELRITWSDGITCVYTARDLRDKCPCAMCRELRNAPSPSPSPLQLPVISEADIRRLEIVTMKPVGNYAYSIDFSDGHDTGIYTLDSLR